MGIFDDQPGPLARRILDLTDRDYTAEGLGLERLLVTLSQLFGLGVALRLKCYGRGWLRQKRLPCPVISVGNLVAGGTGKTPMAVFVAERLIQLGRRPVVISRGYKGTLGRGPALVGDGKDLFVDAAAAGDEPWMMASLMRFPVVVGRNRYAAGRLALDRLDVDVVVLDDGFQHLALARDLDIVLADYERPLGNGRLLPAGRLREKPCPGRVDCLVLTRSPTGRARENLPPSLTRALGEVPWFRTRHEAFVSAFRGKTLPGPEGVKGRRALLFSGIARNLEFKKAAEAMGVKVLDHLEFPDHYRYKEADFSMIRTRADAVQADLVLTTQKDWVKVDREFDFGRQAGAIGICIACEDPEGFDRFLTRAVRGNDKK